jgi:hypothetical protein
VDERKLLQCRGPKGAFSASTLYKLCNCYFGRVIAGHWVHLVQPCAVQVKFFGWLLAQDRVPTHTSLLKKGILEPSKAICPICRSLEETSAHLFYGCSFARQFWEPACRRHGQEVLPLSCSVIGTCASTVTGWCFTWSPDSLSSASSVGMTPCYGKQDFPQDTNMKRRCGFAVSL